MVANQGRLELTWTNKHLTLLAGEQGGYEWVDPTDVRVSETRVLDEVDSVGEVGPVTRRAADNLLIRGDSLRALRSLRRLPEFADELVAKVKLIYIDPPFNTGQAFANYDDALEHSVWLTMMRDRLVELKGLMRSDATIWVHLDDAEVHRMRCLLDEVFGVANYLGSVVWQKADGPRNDLPNFSVDHDNILVYGRSAAAQLNRAERDESLDSIYGSPDGDPQPWYDDNPTAPSAHRNQTWVYAVQSPLTGDLQYPAKGRCWATKQSTLLQAVSQYAAYELRDLGDDDIRAEICGVSEAEVRKGIKAVMLATDLETARKTTAARQAAGIWPEYVIRKSGTLGRKRLRPTGGVNVRTLWLNDEVGHNRESKAELKALFPGKNPFATPKPERLLEKIVASATDPGDVVLDCFLGSGTTAAVSHKMDRRWVGIELSPETITEFARPRLEKVVAGQDTGGISSRTSYEYRHRQVDGIQRGDAKDAAATLKAIREAGRDDGSFGDEGDFASVLKLLRAIDSRKKVTETRWAGGGGFRVFEVAESMYELDEHGEVFLSESVTNGRFAEAVRAQLGFEADDQPPFCGRKGRARLAVFDGAVGVAEAEHLVGSLEETDRLVLVAKAVDPDVETLLAEQSPGSKIRKAPRDLVRSSGKVVR